MELKLEREHINGYEMVLDTGLYQEETMEAIVPDACSDIGRIIDAAGQICVTGKQIHDGELAISGTVQVAVFYQPEDATPLCNMEVKLPFVIRARAEGLQSQGKCVAQPCLRGVDVRALNPRKVLVRAEVGMALQGFQPQELALCSGVCCDGENGVQQRTVQHMAYVTADVQEKEFTFYDELHLSAGPGGPAQLLSTQAEAWCTESKVIGTKLVFKGEAVLRLRYRVGSELCCMRFPVAFSQIMELTDIGETADCDVTMCVTGVDCVLAGEDGRTANVTLELLGQAVVRDRHPVTVLQDVYSTSFDMVTQQGVCNLAQVVENTLRPQNVRELLETAAPVKSVVDAGVVVCQVKQSQEAGQMVLGAELKVNLLYWDEQEQLQTISRPITVSGKLEYPPQCVGQFSCQCPGEVFAVPTAGGVEVRFTPQFHCLITRQLAVPAVTGAKLGELRGSGQEQQPSVVLRLAAPGEELWDLAKAYSTTRERIMQANDLDGEELPVGKMLLIPGVR